MKSYIPAAIGAIMGATWGIILWAAMIPCQYSVYTFATTSCLSMADASYMLTGSIYTYPLILATVPVGLALIVLLTYKLWFKYAEQAIYRMSESIKADLKAQEDDE